MLPTLSDTRSAFRAATATAVFEGERILKTLADYGGLPPMSSQAAKVFSAHCDSYANAIAERDEAAQRLAEYESEKEEESTCPCP